MTPHVIVYGTSEPQDFALLDDGAALDGSSLTLGLEARTGEDITGVSAAWISAAAGTVRVTGVENLALGRYHVRFTLTDGSGKKGYCPNLSVPADEWHVVRV